MIPMPDGIELAATLYLPPDGGSSPVPALFEFLPYRKDDAMLARDYDLYSYMTQHGYAGARVDIRGTGRSEGELPAGEYTEQEQLDAEAVDRLAGRSAVVHRRRRDVGDLLGRVQRHPVGRAQAPRAQGDHRRATHRTTCSTTTCTTSTGCCTSMSTR